MRTIKLTIEYDGTNYCGWQIQRNGPSIQGELCRAIRGMTGEENHVIGASRTDAGVHALGQVAHFKTRTMIPPTGFMRGINSMLATATPTSFLPHQGGGSGPLPWRERVRVRGRFCDIAIIDAEEAPIDFHAQKDALSKLYRYLILNSDAPSALLSNRCWHIREKLDVEAMKRASECLIGEHDFKSFQAAGSSARDAVRRIEEIRIYPSPRPSPTRGEGKVPSPLMGEGVKPRWGHAPFRGEGGGGRLISIEISGNGFVYHMVRNIVGTLVLIGKGRLKPEDMKKILNPPIPPFAKGGVKPRWGHAPLRGEGGFERKRAGATAPAHGLYLVRVSY